jgi:electron transport complex protein RnfG
MLDIRDLLKPALRLFIICFVTAFSLAFVNFITKDTISLRAEQEAEEQRKIVMAEADSFEKLEGWKELDESGLISAVYAAYTGDKLAGYVFSASPSGFGGKIAVTVGISKDKKISGVSVGDNQETPGLGSKTAEEKFTGQFTGKDTGSEIVIVKRPVSEDNEVQAISGATISTNAVASAVQASADLGEKLLKEQIGGGAK